jgi:glutathione synthase/RimK-type ligase-like ATP-grasp enzyme
VALVTCAYLPGLDPDDRLLAAALAARGARVEAAVWDDGAVDWSGYDLAVLRSTWDYPRRAGEFVAWARTVPRLANPAGVVAWNSDKRYLGRLAAAGVPVVPTTWITPDAPWTPTEGEIVVKPAVSAGGIDTGRYDLADPAQRDLAAGHVARLQAAGRLVMVQPYLGAVDTAGETAVLFLGGRYSHAIRKGPLLTGPDLGVDGLFRQEDVAAREPAPAERALADRALGALPFPVTDLLYARVDLVPGPTGEPVVIEVELVEPSLFLAHADGAADRLAAAVLAALAAR